MAGGAAPGEGHVGGVAFGAPPGLAWNPLGGPETFEEVELGYVSRPPTRRYGAGMDAPLPARPASSRPSPIAPDAEAAMVQVGHATARAGRGLEGDRYFTGRARSPIATGAATTSPSSRRRCSTSSSGLALTAEDARRNIVTRGIDLNALVGKPFRIGDVECFAAALVRAVRPPRAPDERPGTLRALIHKAGLRADVLTDGEIRPGSAVVPG